MVDEGEIQNSIEQEFVPIPEAIIYARGTSPLQIRVTEDLLAQVGLQESDIGILSVEEKPGCRHEAGSAELLLMPIDDAVAKYFRWKIVDPIGVQIYLPETARGDIAGFDAAPRELQEGVGIGFPHRYHLMGKELAGPQSLGYKRLG
jgi:hypothetical protein